MPKEARGKDQWGETGRLSGGCTVKVVPRREHGDQTVERPGELRHDGLMIGGWNFISIVV